MHPAAPVELVGKLVGGFHQSVAEQRLRNATLSLSTITAVVRSSFETSRFFPPSLRPEDLGDGAVIERTGKHCFRVHERFEVGQMRYSDISSHSYLFLRSAVIRYLKHYGPLLRVDKVRIKRWS